MLDGRRQLAWIFVVLLFIVAAQPRIASGQPEKHPEAPKVKFLIRTVDGEKKMSKDTFKAGEPILIRALIKNESSRIYPIVYHGDYFQFRFDLRKIGSKRVERFRKDKEEVIAEKSHLPGFTSGLTANPIEPRPRYRIETTVKNSFYNSECSYFRNRCGIERHCLPPRPKSR